MGNPATVGELWSATGMKSKVDKVRQSGQSTTQKLEEEVEMTTERPDLTWSWSNLSSTSKSNLS